MSENTLPKFHARLEALEAARVLRRAELVEALRIEKGRIKCVAVRMKLSRTRVMELVKSFNLEERARELRVQAGGHKSGLGRPPS